VGEGVVTFRVITGHEVTRYPTRPKAVVAYTSAIIANPDKHVTLIEGDELPGIAPKVIAERFGNPPTTDEPRYVGP